jgi:hypothetical protein
MLFEQIGINPCGFCGIDDCRAQLMLRKNESLSITLTCTYHYEKMNYRSAKQPSVTTPCTNVPKHCPLCPLSASRQLHTIWKYNCTYHILIHHATNSFSNSIFPDQPLSSAFIRKLPDIPPQLMLDIFISQQEEHCMGILTEVTTKAQEDQGLPTMVSLLELAEGITRGKERQKRERLHTLNSVGGKKKRGKKKI